jgi:hypothetical protein
MYNPAELHCRPTTKVSGCNGMVGVSSAGLWLTYGTWRTWCKDQASDVGSSSYQLLVTVVVDGSD